MYRRGGLDPIDSIISIGLHGLAGLRQVEISAKIAIVHNLQEATPRQSQILSYR